MSVSIVVNALSRTRTPFTVHCCQRDRRPLLGMTSLNVAHGYVFPAYILPSVHEAAACEQQLVQSILP